MRGNDKIVGYLGGSVVLYSVELDDAQFKELVERTKIAAKAYDVDIHNYDACVPPWELVETIPSTERGRTPRSTDDQIEDARFVIGTPHPEWFDGQIKGGFES